MEPAGALRKIFEAAADLLQSAQPAKSVLQLPRERRAMYARELLDCFAADPGVAADLIQLYSRYRPWLDDMIALRANWDGQHQTLEEALWLGYRGFEDLDAIGTFGDDARAADLDMTRAIGVCNDAMVRWGIRAEWGGTLLLAALLRHALRERFLEPVLMGTPVGLWPAGPSLVTESPAELAVRLSWHQSVESKSAARQRMYGAIDAWLSEVEDVDVGLGRRTSMLRTVQRDVEATYLRLRDPHSWTWGALNDRYSGAQYASQISGNGIRLAIIRVATVLRVDLPGIPRGRPSKAV